MKDTDSPQDKLRKQIFRQRNLQRVVADSQVCIVADPYVISLDGLPKIEFLLDNFKKKPYRPSVQTKEATEDNYLKMERK